MHATLPRLVQSDFPPLQRNDLTILQINLGYRCNQSCQHCHVNAGPGRTEQMSPEGIDEVIAFLERSPRVAAVDLTGGAPELNPDFRRLVSAARSLDRQVTDRCNLTILEEAEGEGLAEFLAALQVEVVASLPCYLEENVDRQRGAGVFGASIRALRRLNELGYGHPAMGLKLDLVYNPQGALLPPAQYNLEKDYKRHLAERYGVHFNRLLTLANMPIKRFGSMLISKGQFDDYQQTLRKAHRDENLEHVMCRNLISVDWQGYLYDCDFNQQLGLPIANGDKPRLHISALDAEEICGMPIRVADHCYGCTAGQGSSCGGAFEQLSDSA
ncbi:MAG: arsenosugar biosynthesis radical SAM protein ArsS [Candidatus Thiodiazotropha sp.]